MTTTHPPHTRTDGTRTALRPLMVLARAGAVGFTLIVALLHVLSSEFDPVSGLVSEYVLGDYPWLMRLAFLSVTLALFAVTLLVNRALPPSRRRTVAPGLLTVTTASTLVAGVFDTDPKAVLVAAPSTSGLIHYWAFMSSVVAALVAMAVLWRPFSRTPGWREHARPQLLFAAAMLAAFLLTFASTEIVGLTERAFLIVTLTWIVVASGWLAAARKPASGPHSAAANATSTAQAAASRR
jgi:hypothetical protein